MMRILVCGGRKFANAWKLTCTLNELASSASCIIHGCAPGADRMADAWAREMRIKVDKFPARWAMHGNEAGEIRNRQMLTIGKPDFVIAFNGGRGTANMIELAEIEDERRKRLNEGLLPIVRVG